MSISATFTQLEPMADFRPFLSWRYHPGHVEFQKVIAPPYDVISETEQAALYERSPYNCIRLILNKIQASDTETNNRYTRARDIFETWRHEDILIQSTVPAVYVYRQNFQDPATGKLRERTALLGRLKLEPFEKGIVIAHEKTLAKPKADRRKLLEATQTNFSPIFGLYEDPAGTIAGLLEDVFETAPLYQASDDQGVNHRLWALKNHAIMEALRAEMSSRKIYIADGHHRYQTALDYSREIRKSKGVAENKELPSDFTLMALVEFSDPGLILMPTHRMVLPFAGFDRSRAVEVLKTFFDVQAIDGAEAEKRLARPGVLPDASGKARTEMGLMLGPQEFYWLTLKDAAAARAKMPAGRAPLFYGLDVALVSHLVLGALWNLPEDQWESTIRYTHALPEALESVRQKKAAAAFLLQPPRVELLREMGKANELLPQKSTYFYPKLASGLVFHHHPTA